MSSVRGILRALMDLQDSLQGALTSSRTTRHESNFDSDLYEIML
jgi:hypothetical protein